MKLEPLDPRITEKLLEGHQDILTREAERQDKFYAAQSCPRCGGSCQKLADHVYAHAGADVLQRYALKCLACGEEFDPHTGITLKCGNIGKAFVTPPIIGQDQD